MSTSTAIAQRNSELLGYKIFNSELAQLDLKLKLLISTINQYSFIIAEKDKAFKEALSNSDVLLPDGVGIVAAFSLLKKERVAKIAGADIHKHLLQELERNGGSCMYLGSSDTTLKAIQKRLDSEYPNIQTNFYSPPYKAEFSEEDNALMIEAVNVCKPDVLFVGMTAPKQEKWAYAHKDALDANVICAIGAVFDFYAGTVRRPGDFWVGLGLEWLGRLLKEPKRMWKRYLYYGPVFGFILSKEKFKQTFNLSKNKKQDAYYAYASNDHIQV